LEELGHKSRVRSRVLKDVARQRQGLHPVIYAAAGNPFQEAELFSDSRIELGVGCRTTEV
jgi:hypothetical protein